MYSLCNLSKIYFWEDYQLLNNLSRLSVVYIELKKIFQPFFFGLLSLHHPHTFFNPSIPLYLFYTLSHCTCCSLIDLVISWVFQRFYFSKALSNKIKQNYCFLLHITILPFTELIIVLIIPYCNLYQLIYLLSYCLLEEF